MRRLPAFGDLGERISDVSGLDVVVRAGVRAGTRALPSRSRDALHGVPLGEPLHPVLTDVTIGAWTSSFLLDIFGGRAGRPAARQLVALGVLSAVPTIASGAADWLEIDAETQRVGAVHAMTNVVATLLYGWSWAARRRGHHARGVRLGLAGAAVATIGGGLGGYLVFRRATGVNRSLGDEGPNDWTTIDSTMPSGSPGVVQCDGAQVLVYLDAGQLDAIGDTCSHQGAPLHEGEVFDGCVRCPWHGSEFRLRDGSVRTGPATAPQPRYEARIDGPGYQLRRARHNLKTSIGDTAIRVGRGSIPKAEGADMSEFRTPSEPTLASASALAPDSYLQGEATTLIDVLHQFEESGFGGQFDERDGCVRCLTCRQSTPPDQISVRALRRLEGASDPADALAVAAVVCPHCGASGALTLNYGPEATPGEAEVLLALPDADGELRPGSEG